ncbi:MAG: sensor histidine kinase [Pseudomonadota bacterium]
MTFARSLRTRLLVLILAPLMVMACLLGYWRYAVAIDTAEALFDRALLAAALAISRDVTVSGGDALSITTRDLIAEASGGQVFYHVEGPDRTYVTGYAYPPIPQHPLPRDPDTPEYYEAHYRGEDVRVLRLLEESRIGFFPGLTTLTVWQSRESRRAFANASARQSAILIAALILTVALIIWFGINRGLRPLLSLEGAIAARSSDDLSPIRRAVPREVQGIVARLNRLFGQVREALQARDVFISNAAHQLRNPVAGLLALAETAETATTEDERIARLRELKSAAARTARLTTQMLALERIKGATDRTLQQVDLNALANDVALRNADRILARGIAFDFRKSPLPAVVDGDPVLLEEALENLIDNAIKHGGPDLTRIMVSTEHSGHQTALSVEDNGKGLPVEDIAVALERFSQVQPSDGSGLGLAIVNEIAEMHRGKLVIEGANPGVIFSILFAE